MKATYRRRSADALAVAVGAGVFLPCALIARSGEVGPAERSVFEAINGLPDWLSPPMQGAQFLGVLVVGPAVAIVALLLRRPRLALAAILVTAGKLAAERLVWKVIERKRPGVTEPDAIVRGGTATTGASFVSGHVVLVMALAWVIAPYLAGRWRLLPWLVVGIVSFARIYLGAHNPLDVLGGLGLGLVVGAVANLLVGTPEPTPWTDAPATAPASTVERPD